MPTCAGRVPRPVADNLHNPPTPSGKRSRGEPPEGNFQVGAPPLLSSRKKMRMRRSRGDRRFSFVVSSSFFSFCFRSMAIRSHRLSACVLVRTFIVLWPPLLYTSHVFLALGFSRSYLLYRIYPFPLLLSFPSPIFSHLVRFYTCCAPLASFLLAFPSLFSCSTPVNLQDESHRTSRKCGLHYKVNVQHVILGVTMW